MKNMGFIYLMAGIALIIIGVLTIRIDKSNKELNTEIAGTDYVIGENTVIPGKSNSESSSQPVRYKLN